MTPKDAKKLLPIIEAYSEGKEIEFSRDGGKTWFDSYDYKFNLSPECYRIKNKHQELIYAFNQGAKIQFLSADGTTWRDVVGTPYWHEKVQYMIKSKPYLLKYRRYIIRVGKECFVHNTRKNTKDLSIEDIESSNCFVRWIDKDWITEAV